MGIKETLKKLIGPKEGAVEPRREIVTAEEVELNSYLREEHKDNIRNELLKKRAERVGKLFGYENYGPEEDRKKFEIQQNLPCPGNKIRSQSQGRGLGFGKTKGPVGTPIKKKIPKSWI